MSVKVFVRPSESGITPDGSGLVFTFPKANGVDSNGQGSIEVYEPGDEAFPGGTRRLRAEFAWNTIIGYEVI